VARIRHQVGIDRPRVSPFLASVGCDDTCDRRGRRDGNEIGLVCLDPRWAGGRPRLLSDDDEDFVIQTATTRPTKLGKPFTRWSIRKLADHLRRNLTRPIRIGREALRLLLRLNEAEAVLADVVGHADKSSIR
jgi:hypothetical protein